MLDGLRKFLSENNIDYLLINSSNEYLIEYNKLESNSRYLVTNFSGSTGEALLAKDRLYLFVDGRYHEQADDEVNPDFVQVVKLGAGKNFVEGICEMVKPDTTFAITASKVSLRFFNNLKTKFDEKNIKIIELHNDLVQKSSAKYFNTNIEPLPLCIRGMSADEKFKLIAQNISDSEAIIVSNIEDVAYLTNLRSYDIEYSSAFYAKAILTSKKAYIFIDGYKKPIGDSFGVYEPGAFDEILTRIAQDKKIGVSPDRITLQDFRKVEANSFMCAHNYIANMKSVKNHSELEHIKSAYLRTDIVVQKAFDLIRSEKQISEFELSIEIEKEFIRQGANALSFKTILASGANSSIVHYSSPQEDKIIQKGDLVLIDTGAYFEGGYATDITRTYVFGEPNQAQKELYTTVLKAYLQTYFAKIDENITGFELDKIARDFLNEHKPDGYSFSHSLGHGVGIGVHEAPPTLAPLQAYATKLVPNMVFTLEPALYKAGTMGVRLENSVYLTEDYKLQTLSKAPFDDRLIDKSILTAQEVHQLNSLQD